MSSQDLEQQETNLEFWSSLKVKVSVSCNPKDYSLPGSSFHRTSQASILEWAAILFSRGYSWPRDRTTPPALKTDSLASEPPALWLFIQQMGFPPVSDGKEPACNAGVMSLIPGSGRSPGEGNGNPLQYSCLENPMDRGAWRLHTVNMITKCQTLLSDHTFTFTFQHVFTALFSNLGSGAGRWVPGLCNDQPPSLNSGSEQDKRLMLSELSTLLCATWCRIRETVCLAAFSSLGWVPSWPQTPAPAPLQLMGWRSPPDPAAAPPPENPGSWNCDDDWEDSQCLWALACSQGGWPFWNDLPHLPCMMASPQEAAGLERPRGQRLALNGQTMHGLLSHSWGLHRPNSYLWWKADQSSLQNNTQVRTSNRSIQKEISPECSLEGLMLKLKLQ